MESPSTANKSGSPSNTSTPRQASGPPHAPPPFSRSHKRQPGHHKSLDLAHPHAHTHIVSQRKRPDSARPATKGRKVGSHPEPGGESQKTAAPTPPQHKKGATPWQRSYT